MKKIILALFSIGSIFVANAQSVLVDAPVTADTALSVRNNGTGPVGSFITKNTNNTGALVYGDHYGKGGGIRMRLLNAQNTNAGMYLLQFGNGDGMYISSNKSKSASFYTNAGNADTSVFINSDGAGTGLQVNLNYFSNSNSAINALTKGTGKAGYFEVNNPANNAPVVDITTNGTGRGVWAAVTNASSSSAALYGYSAGNRGVEGVGANIGVLGQSLSGSTFGIGVKGVSNSTNFTSGAVTGISNAYGVAVYGESTAGGIGLYGKTSKSNGAAIYGVNDALQGQAIKGSATGPDGIAIYGEAGSNNSNSQAAYFINLHPTNGRTTVQIANNGTGRSLLVENTNPSNIHELISATNYGTGNFVLLKDGAGNSKTSIANTGNITTEGNVTVKGTKGIVRNSNATQLRTETVIAEITVNDWITSMETKTVNVTFSTPFSAPPVVYIGNNVHEPNPGEEVSAARFMTLSVSDVTTNGCKLRIINGTATTKWLASTTSWNLVAIGAE